LESFIPGSPKAAVPVDLNVAARYVGIEQILEVEMGDCDGLLSSTKSGSYVASLRKGQPPLRKRFTLAHEVGHAIVYRSIGRQSSEINDGRLRCRAETADERDEERLCDIVAAELLMPRAQFIQTMDELGVCAATVPDIAQRFGVSLQATCRRLAQLSPYDIAASLWKKNEENGSLIPTWNITKKGVMPLDHVIEDGQTGSECFADEIVRGWQWIPLHGQMDKYFIDVYPLRRRQRAWLVLVVFDNAAQQILANISKGRTTTVNRQLPLIGE
jgi:Zn-dependent peptidase ImmA (M78 family)